MEKMYSEDKARVLKGFMGGMDVEAVEQFMAEFAKREEEMKKQREQRGEQVKEKTERRSVFMEAYAWGAQRHMEAYGTTQRQLAVISSKNHYHSTMNPLAQYQKMLTVEEVLAAPEVAWPLTRPMCSPIGDGTAAAVVCSDDFAKKIGARNVVEVAACCLASGMDRESDEDSMLRKLAYRAYEKAGIGPQDLSLAEVHDATAFGELSSVEQLGICPIGEGGPFAEAGNTMLGGKIPVNVSGGLESQGHPVGATGCRQVVELFWHLTCRAGKRQVQGAKVGLAQNAGGSVRGTEAALSVTILKK
jgi:acetyl-CoA acetyltransferase